MIVYVALLRAVNVGGTGSLKMSDLCALCQELGFERPQTYIQSGNVVFGSKLPEAKVRSKLEPALAGKLGKACGVLVRTGAELDAVLAANPFPEAPPNRVIVFFLSAPPARGAAAQLSIPGKEQVEIVGREVFVHYPDGQGRSKLKLPFASEGTGRNLNTVMKLAELARAFGSESTSPATRALPRTRKITRRATSKKR